LACVVYQVQLSVSHPPVDAITLHCTIGLSISKSPHGALIAAWAGLLGAIDVPYVGGTFKLSAAGAIPYFGLTATASFAAHRG